MGSVPLRRAVDTRTRAAAASNTWLHETSSWAAVAGSAGPRSRTAINRKLRSMRAVFNARERECFRNIAALGADLPRSPHRDDIVAMLSISTQSRTKHGTSCKVFSGAPNTLVGGGAHLFSSTHR